ncbi:helix-hairpin-helix domain-containing protein [Mailhella massiliensis]|uniref:Helix-hairpin-helix domain-containing protein n=1 Tax=Mailhella massiliensis TaxID=1903261 RepID=A0A921AWW6_9BACT|nr:helix-hairpin-helix domain-containing protein [Mailhella massiliensis]HJD97342.1 helix-hairpin-helix domain-containing protein [Mailhella massiliensis]
MKRTLIPALALTLCLGFSSPVLADEEKGVNVNTATQEELASVPGLNAELAGAIVSYREDMGDFMSLDELSDVPGMSKENLEQAKEVLRVDAVSGAECNC